MEKEEYESRKKVAEDLFAIARDEAYAALKVGDIEVAEGHLKFAQGYLDRIKELEIQYGKSGQ